MRSFAGRVFIMIRNLMFVVTGLLCLLLEFPLILYRSVRRKRRRVNGEG